MASVTIQQEYDDGVWEWRFGLFDTYHRIALLSYSKLTRPSKRHKWRKETLYDAYARKGSGQMKAQDVPIPADVERKVKDQIIDQFTVTKTIRDD